MLRTELESLAARFVPGAGPVHIHMLRAGLVNETYRVVRDGVAHVLRVGTAQSLDLGIDREWEARVQESAARAGLAPAVEYCDVARGIMVSRWTPGRSWSAVEVRRAANIAKIAALLRRVHALPMPDGPPRPDVARRMSPGGWIDFYHDALERFVLPRTLHRAVLRAAAGAHLERLTRLPAPGRVVCHSDLHTGNLIEQASSLILLDWEYAHASESWWDLAGWSANNDFAEALRRELLSTYLGRAPTPHEGERLDCVCWLYDYTCLLWSELYVNLAAGAAAGEAAIDGVRARARLLATRLDAGLE
jgi:thiamine kinase-like enzyme